MWGVPPPRPDPELEAKYGRRNIRDIAGSLLLGLLLLVVFFAVVFGVLSLL